MVEATTPSHDEDEKYLYGENTESPKTKTNGDVDASTDETAPDTTNTSTQGSLPSQEPKKESQDEEEEDEEDGEFEEDESDDDDDDIQVHIGEVNAATPGAYGTPVNWKKDGPTTAAATNKLAVLPTQGQKKIDVNAVGLINGQPIYEYDLDTEADDKPWRKPGADISDYFNYGFNEETWKQYCDKQRRMRMESQRSPYTVTQGVPGVNHATQNAQVEIEVLPDGRTRVKAGPPPDRKVEGSIHVLGSTEDARRKQKEDELLALALNSTRVLPPGFPGQRPLYTALPGGAVVYNPIPGQPMPPQMITPLPSSSQADNPQENNASEAPNTSQPQQIQSLGGPPVVQYITPSGQQLPPGMQPMMPNQQVFPPQGGPPMGMEFQQDPFNMHPGVMMPQMGGNFNQFPESDSERDSDGAGGGGNEGRSRHRSSRRDSKHRRHRDRSDRDRSERDKDRDHRDRSSRRERDRGSDARRNHDHSKTSSSDRKSKHSSRSIKTEDDGERKPRVSSRRRESGKSGDVTVDEESTRESREAREREPRESRERERESRENVKKEPSERTVEVKQEPSGD